MTEVTVTGEMYKMLIEFNNEINELKGYYLAGDDEQIADVIENTSWVYKKHQNVLMIIYLSINKELKQNKYLNQDSHDNHYQFDSRHKKLLLKE